MSENEIVTTPAINYNKETIDVVKSMIFKDATDSELMLFFHKCRTVGCHPLDRLIIPSKFNDGQGGKTVVFITTIDYFRSVAETTGQYDGQNEAIIERDEQGNILCAKVAVYRKDISRPFVGVANWSEFYPDNEKKAFQWKRMPVVMISKCAEAQAFRKAFPLKLNKLYAEEEMDQAASMTPKTSTKPILTQKTQAIEPPKADPNHIYIEDVSVKEGVDKKGKPYKKYGVKIGGEFYGTFDTKMGEEAILLCNIETPIVFQWEQSGQYKNLKSISPETAAEATRSVMGQDDFVELVKSLAGKAGITDIDGTLKMQLKIEGLAAVTTEKQGMVIDLFNFLIENKGK